MQRHNAIVPLHLAPDCCWNRRKMEACHSLEDMLYSAVERCLSGRKCRSRKAVGCKPSWVRIPLSPPGRDILKCDLATTLSRLPAGQQGREVVSSPYGG